MIEDNTPKLYCYNHPNRETQLRCNRCNRPICAECAVLTETGYRCKECVRGQQKIFVTAQWIDYPVAAVIAAVLSYVGSLIVGYLGFFTIFVAPIVGVVIAEVVRWATRRHRAPWLYRTAVIAAVVVGLFRPLLYLLAFTGGGVGLGLLSGLLWQGVYLALMASSLFYRLSGIRIG